MRKRLGREVALLCLPVFLVGGMGWLVQAALRPRPIQAVEIGRETIAIGADGVTAKDDLQVNLTLDWEPSRFERPDDIPVRFKSWLLDADGKFVAGSYGGAWSSSRITSDGVTKNLWQLQSDFRNIDAKESAFKPPFTFQGRAKIGNSAPFEWSYQVPATNSSETPNPSIYPFEYHVTSLCGTSELE